MLMFEPPGKEVDCGASALREAFELAGLEESMGVNRRQLDDHPVL
jgi:hypothetical protein